ncbi:fimbrial biogenesis chaperone [Stenotrophomonas pigmentata]|uniref:fimbrial biogenesis chaperone n=1 Tax=Stenotrophomonas pigmentata TaxID=3055080 RepID=UPI0026EF6714|nr:fimbria/pilus periplasmic chaperone [Stenotrophomonas sp. 610A2]
MARVYRDGPRTVRGIGLVLLLFACLLPAAALAATSLQLAPTSLQLEPRQRAAELWLTNSGTSPVTLQVRMYRWIQQDGQEQLLPTDELTASPPMQQLAAGQQQLIRVMRPLAEPPAEQRYYRMIVDQVPDLATRATGMQFVLRYSIPVFIQPIGGDALASRLQARLTSSSDGGQAIEIHNAGDGYAQVADLAFGSAEQPRIVHPGLLGYVLPGQTMRWPLQHKALDADSGQITAKINGDSEQTPIPPSPPH